MPNNVNGAPFAIVWCQYKFQCVSGRVPLGMLALGHTVLRPARYTELHGAPSAELSSGPGSVSSETSIDMHF